MIADGMLDVTLAKSPHAAIPWWLMASFAYYLLDDPILSDARNDALCASILDGWADLTHPHKYAVDKASLTAGTAFGMKPTDYPPRVLWGLQHLTQRRFPIHTYAEHLAAQAESVL